MALYKIIGANADNLSFPDNCVKLIGCYRFIVLVVTMASTKDLPQVYI